MFGSQNRIRRSPVTASLLRGRDRLSGLEYNAPECPDPACPLETHPDEEEDYWKTICAAGIFHCKNTISVILYLNKVSNLLQNWQDVMGVRSNGFRGARTLQCLLRRSTLDLEILHGYHALRLLQRQRRCEHFCKYFTSNFNLCGITPQSSTPLCPSLC
jgi:hypothetical protein